MRRVLGIILCWMVWGHGCAAHGPDVLQHGAAHMEEQRNALEEILHSGRSVGSCGIPMGRDTPQFHVRDASCRIQDPSGPFYDPVHQMYHSFYDDHANSIGLVWGHVVSRDLAHWAHVPVALHNDTWYDSGSLLTGSTTMVNGNPAIIYAAVCDSSHKGCDSGCDLSIAFPTDRSDPFLTKWTKASYNPILPNSQRDPSTAWQSSEGEWRLTTFDGRIAHTWDFANWSFVGDLFLPGECPDFFPLPRDCEGCEGLETSSPRPTHVHKCSYDKRDWVQLGTYAEGAPNTTGTWSPTPGVSFGEVLMDHGDEKYYASKSFFDPVNDRRIVWGWAAVPPMSTHTLPREVTYEPRTSRLRYSPVTELAALRSSVLTAKKDVKVKRGQSLWLGDWVDSAGNQSEAYLSFTLPPHAASFGLKVMLDGEDDEGGNVFGVDYAPSRRNMTVWMKSRNGGYASIMPNTNLPGSDFNKSSVTYRDPSLCQLACNASSECRCWTFSTGPTPHEPSLCCLKSTVRPRMWWDGCTSGVKLQSDAWNVVRTATVTIPPGETSVDMRVFVDNTFIEAYIMKGEAVFTTNVDFPISQRAGMALFSTAEVTAQNVTVWKMGSIWVSREEMKPS